jgi:hypothetical protein
MAMASALIRLSAPFLPNTVSKKFFFTADTASKILLFINPTVKFTGRSGALAAIGRLYPESARGGPPTSPDI